MIAKTIEEIGQADIHALLSEAVPEGRTLDYKAELPGNSDDAKRELLADVSSFANAAGGDIVFGVAESGGSPSSISGLTVADLDAEKLRLEEIIRNGIAPRLPSITMKAVPGFTSGPVLVLRIARSFVSPHMVTFKQWSRFFTRNNAGKHQMDVTELRSAFMLSETLVERVQRFRTDRLSKIIAGETPVAMSSRAAKLVVHVIPLNAFSMNGYIEGELQYSMQSGLRPIAAAGWNHRHNFDGFLAYNEPIRNTGSRSYTQFFRSGAAEAVWADLVRERDGHRFIASVAYERYVIDWLRQYLNELAKLAVPFPLIVTMSMTGVKGARLFVGPYLEDGDATVIDRDTLILPDIMLKQFDEDVAAAMRPLFDAVWNAAGYARSFNYDDTGRWAPQG